MFTKVSKQENGLFLVEVFEKEGDVLPIDYIEHVANGSVQLAINQLRRDNFTVQAYLAEIPIAHEEQRSRVENIVFDLSVRKHTATFYYYRYAMYRMLNDTTVKVEDEVGTAKDSPDTYTEVLELWLSRGLEVEVYGPDGLKDWAEGFEFKSLAEARISWNGIWKTWRQLKKFFTKEELENIAHAFKEGRHL